MQAAKEARSRGVSDEGAADFATWKLPSEGWFKVNTDGARNSSNGMACCGVLSGMTRVDGGSVLLSLSESIRYLRQNFGRCILDCHMHGQGVFGRHEKCRSVEFLDELTGLQTEWRRLHGSIAWNAMVLKYHRL
ncbi:hypothetical protein V6N12_060203 [Hibiscus sabdariffa]|uniref:RNase H type-1 domain-containing protein n=1 Tax=Hibiscus sabdariffa TaxID=183260 RepID=A0ABR2D3S3_9ROSI